MTGAMEENIICLTNRKTMMTKFMQSQFENIMKSKLMKKVKQLTSKKVK